MRLKVKFKTIFITLLSLLFISCGGGNKSEKVEFSYSLGGIVTGTPMDGGIYLWAVRIDPDTGDKLETLMMDLIDDSAQIPFGNWEFHLVGYAGPGAWSGTNYCGSVPETFLDSNEITVSVTFTAADCSNLPYTDMVAQKAADLAAASGALAVWDSGSWDAASWDP